VQEEQPTADPGAVAAAFSAVSAALWSQRDALETVLFKLVEERFVVASGSARWLNRADDEVRSAIATMQMGEVLRAVEVEALAQAVELPGIATLDELADALPEPSRLILRDHRSALRSLVAEIEAVAEENRRLLNDTGLAGRG
jgi:hypothetical protein